MDTASATTMKVLSLQTSAYLTSQILPSKPNAHALSVPNSNPRSRALSLTRCSTKPDTDNEKDQNSTVEPLLNSKPINPSPPTSIDPLSSPISSFPSSSTKGLVFDLGLENSWDEAKVRSPIVKRYLDDEEERWYMWYNGRSDSNLGSDSIGLAVSRNGVHWERGGGAVQSSQDVGLVMSSGKDWWAFDTRSGDAGVLLIVIDGQRCCHDVGLLLCGLDCRFTVELELEMHGCRVAAVVNGGAAGCPNQLEPAAV